MKYLLSLLVASSLLIGCSQNLRQIASLEAEISNIEELKTTEIPTFGFANLGAHFIKNREDHLRAEIFIILKSVRKQILASSKIANVTEVVPLDDFFRIFEQLKRIDSKEATDRNHELLTKLKAEAIQLNIEAKDYYSLILFQKSSNDELQKLKREHEAKKGLAQKKFDIDMTIVGYQSDMKRNDLLKDVVVDSKKYHKEQLNVLETERSKIDALFKSYLHRNNLYTSQIKDAREYRVHVQESINELKKRISPAIINEMNKTVAKCIVPQDLNNDLSNCDKAKRVLAEIIAKLNDNIKNLEAEMKSREADPAISFGKDSEVPDTIAQTIEKSLTNSSVVALKAEMNETKRLISIYEGKLSSVNISAAKAQADNKAMEEKIDSIIAQTKQEIEEETFKRDEEVRSMITHALASLNANKNKEEMFSELLNELDQVIMNVIAEIENSNSKIVDFNELISVLKDEVNVEKRKKKRL